MTIITHKGLSSTPYYHLVWLLLQQYFSEQWRTFSRGLGFNNVCIYLDDILVTGSSERDHLDNLAAVLEKLEAAGVRLKGSKCHFMLPSVEYLGHKISDKGI